MLAALAFSLVSACTDYIEVPQPAQSLPSDAALSDVAGLETALIGAYDALQSSDFGATGIAMNPNIMADNGEWRGSFPSYIDMYNRQLTANNGEVAGLWQTAYLAINHANLVLNGIATIDDPALTPEVSDRLEGEALFLRGMAHFELVRYFGKPWGANSSSDLGVPIMTTPVAVVADITFPPRNTVAEVYGQAIEDLTNAARLLDPTGARGQANSTAANAYLARIAFQQRRYQDAADLAQQVLDAGYALTASPEEPFFSEGTSEEIFAVINTPQDNPGVNGSLATFHHVNGRGGDVVVSEDLKTNGYGAIISSEEQAEAAPGTIVDLRPLRLTSSDVFNIEKYEDFANNSDDNMVVRLAEFYLMRAEALARIDGINAESLELLNAVRTRALRLQNEAGELSDASAIVAYEAGDFADADELIEAIILERRVELAFEGDRLHDLRRLERDVRGLPFDDDRLVFPIPQREIDANDQLIQNPGY
jgi:tetratricopeptide (TPR) repeat protein